MNPLNKPRSHIEDWVRLGNSDTSLGFLIGRCINHHRQEDFHTDTQRTSSLVEFNEAEGYAETRNTFYTLGLKASEVNF